MPELWEDQPTSAFELPGDEEIVNAGQTATQEPEAQETTERPRDEAGRFVADQSEETTEEASEETTEEETPGERLLAGNFKTVEELEKGYEQLRSLSGRQGSELKELRDAFEQRMDEFEERVAPKQAPSYDLQELQQRLDANPTLIPQVAQAAYEQGHDDALDVALVLWEEHDQFGAKRFQRALAAEEAKKAVAASAERNQKTQSAWQEAGDAFAKAHPDFNQYAGAMEKLAPEYPQILSLLESGDSKAQQEVLSFLYREARDRSRDNLESQTREIKAESDAETDRAIEEAAVVSGSTTHSEQKLTPAEEMGKAWEDAKRPYDDGWTI